MSIAMRSVCISMLLSMAASFSARADIVPFDPEILIDTGGDATNIDYTGLPITVGPNGGGIFVFHNATGNPLNEIDINLDFPMSPLPNGFSVTGTIGIPAGPHQHSTFQSIPFSGFDCTGAASLSFSCIEMKFKLLPGPLIPTDGNFVLDFNNSADYTDADFAVLDGNYNGPDIPGGAGSWGSSTSGNVIPSTVPEPSYRVTTVFMALGLLFAWNFRRRLAAKKS
jgi:hypothetical protein